MLCALDAEFGFMVDFDARVVNDRSAAA